MYHNIYYETRAAKSTNRAWWRLLRLRLGTMMMMMMIMMMIFTGTVTLSSQCFAKRLEGQPPPGQVELRCACARK